MKSNPRSDMLRQEYAGRIYRVMDYIENNIDSDLSLETLARVANFSMYHFHRIFASIAGETLNRFIQRVRVERAATMLVNSPAVSVTEAAYACGFSGSSAFARSFKEYFGMSATEWRNLPDEEKSNFRKMESNIRKPESNTGKDINDSAGYIMVNQSNNRRNRMFEQMDVTVKDFPEMNVAYVRHIGPYQGDEALFSSLFNKLCTWAGPRGLLNEQAQMLAVYHDNPDITEGDKLRLSICVTVPENTKTGGDVGMMKIPGGKYAAASFELKGEEYQAAWDAFFSEWLPESGYQPVEGPCFELYKNDPSTHPEGKCIVDICVPVKPL